MLETERYSEAAELLEFLLQSQGQDPRLYDEWQALRNWLMDAFPTLENGIDSSEEDMGEEAMARYHVEMKLAEDEQYAERLLHTVMDKPMSEHTLLGLEQLAYINRPEIDEALTQWLVRTELHPLLQYKVLQTLRRRGMQGVVSFFRFGEYVEVEIESVPIKPDQFPEVLQDVLERVGDQTQVYDPTLFDFAREMWSQFIMAIYGTADYRSLLSEEEAMIDIWAAALHRIVTDSLPVDSSDEEIRNLYGITDRLRFRYEQACRSMRLFMTTGLNR